MAESVSTITLILEAASAIETTNKLEQSIMGMERAARSAGVQSAAAFTQVEAVAATAASRYALFQQKVSVLDAEIKRLSVSLALQALNAREAAQAGNTGAYETWAGKVRQTTTSLNELTAQQVATKAEMSALKAEMAAANVVTAESVPTALAAARAEQALALAHTETAAAAGLTTRQTVQLGVAVDRLSGVAIPGGRAIGTLAGAFSLAMIPQLAMIVVISLLIAKIIEYVRAQNEVIKLDQDMIASDTARANAIDRGTLFTVQRLRSTLDAAAADVVFRQTSTQLTSAIEAESAASVHLNELIVRRNALSNQAGEESQQLGFFIRDETRDVAALTGKRLEHQKKMDEEISARIRLGAESFKTREDLLREALLADGTTAAYFRLVAALDAGALAEARFRQGQGVIGQARTQVAQEAAAAGVTLTHAEALKRFNAELAKRGEETVKLGAETALTEKNLKAFNDEHVRGAGHVRSGEAAIRSYSNALVDLQARAKDAEAALTLDELSLQRFRITTQIEKEREHLVINKKDKQAASDELTRIEIAQLALVDREWATSRAARLATDREFRQKEINDLRLHLVHQRQIREDEEKKFFKDQAAIEFAARSDRAGRKETQADAIRAQADAVHRVGEAFGFASKHAQVMNLQMEALAKFDRGDFLGGAVASIKALGMELIRSGQLFQMFGQAVSSVFEGIVAGTETAKAAFIKFIAQLLMMAGQMAIALGTIYLFTPGFHGLGVALIVAGVAAMALAGVLTGLASNAGRQSASVGGAATTSGAAATPQRQGIPPNIIPFPTSQQPMVIHNHFDSTGTARIVTTALENNGVFTIESSQGKHRKQFRLAAK